ncbi:MAG: phosphatase [Bryobacteraceae bacterium]
MFSHNFKRIMPLVLAAGAFAAPPLPTHVPSANAKSAGTAQPNVLSPQLTQTVVAQGSMRLEIPSGITAGVFKYYGYNDDGVNAMVPTASGSRVEFRKTEPDKNVYLTLRKQSGADPAYNYGRHFLFQGHETGVSGYLTRINLDADSTHRVTLMANKDINGAEMPTFDGITWYPFSQQLLLTSEDAVNGGVWQATLDVPSKVKGLSGILGNGGYEGIQADPQGRLYIIEDVGGSKGAVNSHARRPNSFVYRFLPKDPADLTKGGKLQALQVQSLAHAGPIHFNFFASPDAFILSDDVKDLHTYGKTFNTAWVTLHDTDVDGTAPFNANAAAKVKQATPFKRPENGQFRPGSGFTEFIFDETGDTDMLTEAGTTYGGFGGIFRLRLTGDTGKLNLVYNGDAAHSGFDNCAFWDADRIVFGEDAGDTLHSQRNALDSAWLFDLNVSYSSGAQPVRILAQGRDVSATLDSLFAGGGFSGSFFNDGDNEITGWHLSDGDPTVNGLLGAKVPRPLNGQWRLFYTQQHGDNTTYEVLRNDTEEDESE